MAAADLQDQIHAFSSYLRVWNDSYAEYAKSLGLSHAGLSVLNCIYRFNGKCTQKMLCTYCYLPKQTVNSIVTTFYKQGWVRLEELPEDLRTIVKDTMRWGHSTSRSTQLPSPHMTQPFWHCITGQSSGLLTQLLSLHRYGLLLGQRVMGEQNMPFSAHSPDGQRKGA